MSPILYSIVASAALFGQTVADDVDAARERSIHAAIRQLGAEDYSTREQAYRQLSRLGLAAEAALKRAAKSRDGETRLRANRLLRDIEYGILPGVDAGTRKLIRDFRGGTSIAREAAFQHLVQRERIEILKRLIRLEADPQVRRQLLAQMFQDDKIVDRFIQRDRIEALIEAVGADQDEQWKRAVTMQLMFAPNMLSRLAETGSLDKLLQLIRDETDVQVRQSMLVAIFRTPGVAVVLARNKLDFVLDALRAEPDKKFRGALLGEIFANPQAAQAIAAHKQLELILTFSREQTDAASQQKLVEFILASAPVVESLLKEGGVDRVIALVSNESDPVRRGRLLGAAIASSAVRTFLQRNGLSELALKLAHGEQNEVARHEFLQALLQDTSFVYSLNDEATVAELWKLIKADKNAVWRSQALVVLLRSHRSNALLKDKEEAAWIFELASGDAVGSAREDILRFLLPNDQAQRVLIANGYFDAMLALARELPIRSRGEILGNFLAGSGVAEHLVATKRIELLIDVAKEQPDAGVKQLCLQGVFRNSTAMAALLNAGHYTTFREMIQHDDDPARRASLFGAFVANYQVMDELAKRGDSKLLLAYAETEEEAARQQFLPRLFRNQRAITLLIEEGHFDRLVALAKQEGGTNFDEFLAVPKVIEHLVATKQFALFVDFAAGEADDNTRRSLLRTVFMNPKTVEALIASVYFDRLLRLIQAERDPAWRGTLLGPVLSSAEVIAHFATAKKLDDFFSMISDEPEPVVRSRLISYLTGRSDTVGALIERGNLDTLISLVNRHLAGNSRGSILARILTNSKASERLKAEQRVGYLLSFTGDADAAFTAAYISRLLASPATTDLLVEHGYYGDIFKIATTGHDAKVRAELMGRLLQSRKAVDQMIVRNDVATLVAIIAGEADGVSRRTYLATICADERLIEEMLKGESFDSLVKTVRSERDVTTRNRQLATLLYSASGVAKLAADEQLEQILDDAIAESDTSIRTSWLTNVMQRAAPFVALVKLGYGEKLLDAAEQGIPVANQRSLLSSVCANQIAVATLIEQGHFDRLLTTAKRHGGSQLADLLRSSAVIEHLIKAEQLGLLLESIKEGIDDNSKYNVLYAIVRTEQTRQAILEAGHFETLCELIQDLSASNQRGWLLGMAFSSPEVVRHYIATKTLDRFYTLIEQKTAPAARSQILSYLLSRGDVVDLLVDEGQFETLLRITKEHTTGSTREQLLARLLTSSKTLAKLVADKKVDLLLTSATDEDGLVSLPYLTGLFSNHAAVSLLIDQGHFEDLYKFATNAQDSTARNSLLGRLLVHHKAIEQLQAAGQLAVVVDYAKGETNTDARRAYLAQICSNQLLVAELIRAELFDGLIESCESEPDGDQRRRHFAVLLYSEAAIDRFAATKRLESLVEDSLAEPEKSRRQSWLITMISRSNAFAAMMKHGFGDQLVKIAEQQLEPAQLQGAFRAMLSNSAVISEFAKTGQHRFLLNFVTSEPRENYSSYALARVTSNEDALRAIIKAGGLNELLELATKVTNESAREGIQRQILSSDGPVSAMAEQGKFSTLLELIRDTESTTLRRSCLQSLVFNNRARLHLADLTDPAVLVALIANEDEQSRTGMVMRLIFDTNVRRRWIEAGKVAELEKLIELYPREIYRSHYRYLLFYAPSGVLGHLLRQEKFTDAEAMLYKYSGDKAISWLVSFRNSRGQLAAEIERLRQIAPESRNAYQSRQLLYLLRANDDLPGAMAVAEAIGDPQLLRALLVEQRQWSKAAVLQAEAPLPTPVDVAQATQLDDNTRRIEQLGQLASYHRLAGDDAAMQNAIGEILAFADEHQDNSQLVWHAAEALLLNDCVEEGLRLVKDSRPLVAFNLFALRHDYPAAFAAIGLDADSVADRDWYDALPFSASQSDAQNRFRFAIEVAGTLRRLGDDEAAEGVLSVLEALIQDAPVQGGSSASQSSLRQWYSGGLYRIGLKDRAWSVAAMVVDPRAGYPPSVVADIFGSRVGEAQVWWNLFKHQHGSETPEQRLQRIDAVLNPTTADAIQSFPDLVSEAIAFGESDQNESFWRGLADTCVARGQRELAIECFERIADKSTDATIAYADSLFAVERWADAATAYHDAWLDDYDQLGVLFLAGVAKQRAGEDTEGLAWQRLADLQAVTASERSQLANALMQRGLFDAANAQWRILLRTAPFESLELNEAARQLALNAHRDEPALAAPLWQHYLLGDVRPAFWFLNHGSYLSVPAMLHKIRAIDAIERSDFEAAEREIELNLALNPGDTVVAEEVFPLLDAAGEREMTDRFIAQLVEHYERRCQAHPQSAYLHNNLAWATARCHRRLDEALLHATKAVELEPNNGGYIDTLAEVHFQLGDRDTAIQLSERSVVLWPMATSLQKQLTRFRSAPLPAP